MSVLNTEHNNEIQEKYNFIREFVTTQQSFAFDSMVSAYGELKQSAAPFTICFHKGASKTRYLSSVPNIGLIVRKLGGDIVPSKSIMGSKLIKLKNKAVQEGSDEYSAISEIHFSNTQIEASEYIYRSTIAEDGTLIVQQDLKVNREESKSKGELQAISTSASDEQDELYRKDPAQKIIVRGIPGSGKTSVALERIDFLCSPTAANDYGFAQMNTKEILVLAKETHLKDRLDSTIKETFHLQGIEVQELSIWLKTLAQRFCHKVERKPFDLDSASPFSFSKKLNMSNSDFFQLGILPEMKEFDNSLLELKLGINNILKEFLPYVISSDVHNSDEVAYIKRISKNEEFEYGGKASSGAFNTHSKPFLVMLQKFGEIKELCEKKAKNVEDDHSIFMNAQGLVIALDKIAAEQKLFSFKKIEEIFESSKIPSVEHRKIEILFKKIKHQFDETNRNWSSHVKYFEKLEPAELYCLAVDDFEKWKWDDLFGVLRFAKKLENFLKRIGSKKRFFDKYQHLFIDEYQLYNPNLILFVLGITDATGWTVSGDINQGSSGEKEFLEKANLERHLDEAQIKYECLNLKAGYRWTKQMLQFLIKASIEIGMNYEDQLIEPTNTVTQNGPEVVYQNKAWSKATLIDSLYNKYHLENTQKNNQDICLICSTQEVAKSFGELLNENGLESKICTENQAVKVEKGITLVVNPSSVIGLEFDHVFIFEPIDIFENYNKNVLWTCLTRAKISMSIFGPLPTPKDEIVVEAPIQKACTECLQNKNSLENAIEENHVECLKLLLDNDSSSINIPELILISVRKGHLDCLSFLNERYPGNLDSDQFQHSLALIAVQKNHIECLKFICEKAPHTLLEKTESGMTPAYIATIQNKHESLIAIGNVDVKNLFIPDSEGLCSIHHVVQNNNLSSLEYLVSRDSHCLSLKDNNGNTPGYYAISGVAKECLDYIGEVGQDSLRLVQGNNKYLLSVAAAHQDSDFLEYLALIHPEGLFKADDDQKLASHYASKAGFIDNVKYIALDALATLRIADKEGNTCLHLMAKYEHYECMEFILSERPELFDIANKEGLLPLDMKTLNAEKVTEYKESLENLI